VQSQYLVTYDISDPKRLRAVFRIMKGYGDHMQLSVFRCDLTRSGLVELRGKLSDVIHHDADQVLFFNIGPSEGRAEDAMLVLGRPALAVDRGPVVV